MRNFTKMGEPSSLDIYGCANSSKFADIFIIFWFEYL